MARARLSRLFAASDGAAEDGRRLGGAEPEHVAEHQGGALPGRKVLQGGDKGQRHRFSGLVPRLGSRGGIRQVAEQRVGVGLQPQRLAAAGGLGQRDLRRGQRSRRELARRWFRHLLVAIACSQVRSDERSSNRSSPRQAAIIVSCSMSSASAAEPRIR